MIFSPRQAGYGTAKGRSSRTTLLIIVALITILSLPSSSRGGGEGPPDKADPTGATETIDGARSYSIGAAFAGERLRYTLGFLWFRHAADSTVTLARDGEDYLITLTGETRGFVRWVTKQRKDYYRAYVEEIDGGRRFRLKRFEKEVTIGKRVRRGVTVMDYEKGVLTKRSWGGGKDEKKSEEPIPADTLYDDPLTAFYNFRFGAYGPIEEGREYYIKTFPKNGVDTMYVRIATDGERQKRRRRRGPVSHLADIKIDRELFGSQTGNVEVIFTKELVPLEGVVKDVLLFGDVRGKLTE